MLTESIKLLNLKSGDIVVDATAGGGGHTAKILAKIQPKGRVICIDRDPKALDFLSEKFSAAIAAGTVTLIHASFSEIAQLCRLQGVFGRVSAVLADFGVSSPQLDNSARGFSFAKSGPLDMRMDQSSQVASAASIVNSLSEENLWRIFQDLGEERYASPIARAIVRQRSVKAITRTCELAQLVSGVKAKARRAKHHPATKVFQALRIFVNSELKEIQCFLPDAFSLLRPQGRLGVISFHSLEDRIAKNFCTNLAKRESRCELRHLPIKEESLEASLQAKIVKPFPCLPTALAIDSNFRARSAKLRVIEKLS